VVERIRRKKSVMERLETQRKVREVYMKYVKNGKLVPVDGDKRKGEVTQNILMVILDFLQNHNAS